LILYFLLVQMIVAVLWSFMRGSTVQSIYWVGASTIQFAMILQAKGYK